MNAEGGVRNAEAGKGGAAGDYWVRTYTISDALLNSLMRDMIEASEDAITAKLRGLRFSFDVAQRIRDRIILVRSNLERLEGALQR